MTALIMTHKACGEPLTPHLDALRQSNQSLPVHVVFDPWHRLTPQQAWAQPERLLRRWWQQHGTSVESDEITVMEWDCLVTVPISPMPQGVDLLMARIEPLEEPFRRHHLQQWQPPCEPVLGYPFGFFQVRRWILDRIASREFSRFFRLDIHCETLLPTLAKHLGANMQATHWPHVGWRGHVDPTGPGIWHPVKYAKSPDFPC